MFLQEVFKDIKTFRQKDPACFSDLEVILCHSGFQAILIHRLNHFLWKLDLGPADHSTKLIARVLNHITKILTGIEIHPGAEIGEGFFVDHGAGVVIGETTVIGNNVSVYQGATLGGVRMEKGKRHPTLGDNIIVGTGAKVLGNITIGDYVQIGANSVILKDIPEHSTVVGIPGRVVKTKGQEVTAIDNLEHNNVPDPVADVIRSLYDRVSELESELGQLKGNGVSKKEDNLEEKIQGFCNFEI